MVLATFLGAFGLQNDGSTSLAAVPTAATFNCNLPGVVVVPGISFCPRLRCGRSALLRDVRSWPNLLGSASPGTAVLALAARQRLSRQPLRGAEWRQQGTVANPITAPSPCDIMGTDPNLRSPFVVNYNLRVTHTFAPTFRSRSAMSQSRLQTA